MRRRDRQILRRTVCVHEEESKWPEENGVNLVWAGGEVSAGVN